MATSLAMAGRQCANPGALKSSSFTPATKIAIRPAAPVRARASVVTEANLFSRVFRVAKGYANNLVSQAEDPEKMLDQAVEDMQGDLIKMRQASAQVMASQKQLEAKYRQAQETADDWYRRAELALSKGDDELAKEALKRRSGFAENAKQLGSQLEAQKKATEQLIANTRTLESKLAEAKSKKDTLKARAASAKTSKQIQEMVGSLDTSSSVGAFERMEEKVMAMEAESESIGMLNAGSDLEDKFKALEGGSADDELAKMKANMVKKELPPGRPVKDAIDMELEELRKKARE